MTFESNFCPNCGTPANTTSQKYYCSNCGKLSNTKICYNCGVKNHKVNNYCFWCGQEVKQNATICLNCKEPVRTKMHIVPKVIGLYIAINALFCSGILFPIGFDLIGHQENALEIAAIALGVFLFNHTTYAHSASIYQKTHSQKATHSLLDLFFLYCFCTILFGGITDYHYLKKMLDRFGQAFCVKIKLLSSK